MKKILITIAIIMLICLSLWADGGSVAEDRSAIRWMSQTFATCTDTTQSYSMDTGSLQWVVIDSVGTDIAYNVDIITTIDGVDYTWKTFSCSSASEPYKLAIQCADDSSNVYGGIPNIGVKVRVYNGADLTSCKVILIGSSEWR